MTGKSRRRINVNAITRVEGEGALHVVLEGGRVADVRLSIYEPPRFFEALLRGRPLEEVPDITARICGICPVAYQLTAAGALERALGIKVSPTIDRLRRLLYCGEWMESHGVHIHLLHIPDFFDCDSSIELAKKFPAEVNRGLRLKKHGNQLLEVLGGRAVHPVNVAVGGFYRLPTRGELTALLDDLKWGLDAAIEVARWVAGFEFPDFHCVPEMVAMTHPHEYPMNEGRIESTLGLSIPVSDYESHFEERQVDHSTALHTVRLPDCDNYLVGPLARVNLNHDRLSLSARQVAADVAISWPCSNPYKSIVARAIELVHAFEESIEIIEDYEPTPPARVSYEPVSGVGVAATEAPRGLIYHRYEINEAGQVVFAKIVPPTSQNQGQIESDLRAMLPSLLKHDDAFIAQECEKLIRSYDPCISCATHFLTLQLERR